MDLLSKLVEQLCDCEGRRLNGQARELANDIRERLAALRPVIEKLVEAGQAMRKVIEAEQRHHTSGQRWDAALESWRRVNE